MCGARPLWPHTSMRKRLRNCRRSSIIAVLGRVFAFSGDKTKAKAAYQDFLALWKDADPDIPLLRQAKAEFARL